MQNYSEKPVYPDQYQPPPPPYQQQAYQQQQPVYQPQPQQVYIAQAPQVVLVSGGGTCPHCRIGHPVEEFNLCGIALAFIFFPIGILCCLAMRDRHCSHCGVGL